jgi:hypothetical protein
MAGAAGAKAGAHVCKNLPISPLAKIGVIAGTATLTSAGTAMGSVVGESTGRNLREYAENQIMNSNYNKLPQDGRAPSPNPEFGVHSMLDNFELSN